MFMSGELYIRFKASPQWSEFTREAKAFDKQNPQTISKLLGKKPDDKERDKDKDKDGVPRSSPESEGSSASSQSRLKGVGSASPRSQSPMKGLISNQPSKSPPDKKDKDKDTHKADAAAVYETLPLSLLLLHPIGLSAFNGWLGDQGPTAHRCLDCWQELTACMKLLDDEAQVCLLFFACWCVSW